MLLVNYDTVKMATLEFWSIGSSKIPVFTLHNKWGIVRGTTQYCLRSLQRYENAKIQKGTFLPCHTLLEHI
jgi:hypothetical protein